MAFGSPPVHLMAFGSPPVHLMAFGSPPVHLMAFGPPPVHLMAFGSPPVHLMAFGSPPVHLMAFGPPPVHLMAFGSRQGHETFLQNVQTYSRAHTAYYTVRAVVPSWGVSGRGVYLSTQLHVAPKSKMIGGIPLFPYKPS
jgi:hypothetical protein